MEFKYLQENDIGTPEYLAFYKAFHNDDSFHARIERIHWYFQSEGYMLLVASVDGKYAGQASAYKTKAIINGQEKEWWWGADTFVLPGMRGKGIGKALQKKLHEDCPNFSSASYSATNGIIKRKCGDYEVMGYHRYFCPVSCFFSIYLELVLKKIFGRKTKVPRIRLPYWYGFINGFKSKTDYQVRELTPIDFNEDLSSFIENSLSVYDFHIQRSVDYLKWKYLNNPTVKCIGLDVLKTGQREAVVFFTDVRNGGFALAKARVCKVLDSVIKPGSKLTQKSLLSFIVKYFKDRGEKVDGINTLVPSSYWPKIQYPTSKPSYMLSGKEIPKLQNGYLAYSDQDMEQMYGNNE